MPGVTDMWRTALQDGYCITLYRDEIIMFHKEFQNLLDGMKGWVQRILHSLVPAENAFTTPVSLSSFHPSICVPLRRLLLFLSVINGSQWLMGAVVAQVASARLSEQEVPGSIFSDFNVCFDFPLIRVAIALSTHKTEHWQWQGG